MKIEKVVFTFEETRSASYQSSKRGVTLEATLEEGETVSQAEAKFQQFATEKVSSWNLANLNQMIHDQAQLNAQAQRR